MFFKNEIRIKKAYTHDISRFNTEKMEIRNYILRNFWTICILNSLFASQLFNIYFLIDKTHQK